MPVIDIQGNSLIELNPGKPPKQLPGTYVLEPLKGYWSGNSDWGQARKVAFPTTEGALIPMGRVVNLPGPPRARGILLGRRDKPSSQTADNFGIRAKITYGCGGTTNVAYVDWVNGTQFSLVASTIEIDCETYRPTVNGGVYDVPTDQPDLNIFSAIGTDPAHVSEATYTVMVDTVGVAADYDVAIPQFATAVSVLQSINAGTPTFEIGMPMGVPGVFVFTSAQLTTLLGREIPLPGHALYCTCSIGALWSLRFKLAL